MKSRVLVTKWDRVRAQVFARDNAICAYRGVSVWLLDLGAVPFAEEEWTDHIELASKGGSSEADNLICASVSANFVRNRNPAHPPHYFFGGRPTTSYFDDGYDIGPALMAVLQSGRRVHPTDWYFNRALSHVVGVVQARHYRWTRPDGKPYSRTPTYWLNAAVHYLQKWRRVLDEEEHGVDAFETRGLVRYPDLQDTKTILKLRKATTLSDVREIERALRPCFAHNSDNYYGYLEAASPDLRLRLARKVAMDRRIHPEVKRMIRQAEMYFGGVQGPLYVEA